MTGFVYKYYSILFLVFLTAIVGISFYLGYKEGSTARTSQQGVIFSCPNNILTKQRISKPAVFKSKLDDSATPQDLSPIKYLQNGGAYMGSKNGTKYYTPGCPGSKRIKPENYVWFQTVEDATVQGYTKGSC